VICTAALRGVEEHPPGGERVRQDLREFRGSRNERDLARRTLHRGHEIGCVHGLRRDGIGQQLADLGPRLLHRHAAGQRQEGEVLRLGQHGLQGGEVLLAGEQPDDGQHVGVDAQADEIAVVDLIKQARGLALGGGAQGGGELFEGASVADLEHAELLIHAERTADGVFDGVVVRQDCQQAVDVAGIRRENHATP
jgi:hypothetical protein